MEGLAEQIEALQEENEQIADQLDDIGEVNDAVLQSLHDQIVDLSQKISSAAPKVHPKKFTGRPSGTILSHKKYLEVVRPTNQ